jgi:hypothetical protein
MEGKVNGFQELVLRLIETCHQQSGVQIGHVYHHIKHIRTTWGKTPDKPPSRSQMVPSTPILAF